MCRSRRGRYKKQIGPSTHRRNVAVVMPRHGHWFKVSSPRCSSPCSLEDPATGRRVDLEALGATNAGVFARLLTVQNAR